MNRHLAIVATLGACLAAATARGDYVDPPGWESNPYFTHQSWTFTEEQPPDDPPIDADDGYINPFGVPNTTMTGGSWVSDLGGQYEFEPPNDLIQNRQGGWRFEGPRDLTDPGPVGTIPNQSNPRLTKEFWMQITLKTDVDYLGSPEEIWEVFHPVVLANGDPGDAFELVGTPLLELLGVDIPDPEQPIWYRATMVFAHASQPEFEVVDWKYALEDGYYITVDQIDVDTRCVPEPGMVVLLVLAGLGFVSARFARH